jgi:hypothetical protein
VNFPANLLEQQRQFLEEVARGYGFTGDTETAFRGRFDPDNTKKINKVLAGYLAWNKEPVDKAQKLQDELDKICEVLEHDGCVIERLSTDERKRGRQPKGKSPWEQAFKWLWEEKFRDWQQRQNLDVPSEEEQKEVVCRFLEEIENNFKYDKLLHVPEQPIILKDQYIPIQVTLERRYTHAVETTWGLRGVRSGTQASLCPQGIGGIPAKSGGLERGKETASANHSACRSRDGKIYAVEEGSLLKCPRRTAEFEK